MNKILNEVSFLVKFLGYIYWLIIRLISFTFIMLALVK